MTGVGGTASIPGTESLSRSELEQIYTQKITNIPVSQVLIGAPSPTATPVPVTTVPIYTPVATTVTATTATSGVAPVIQDIAPDNGYAGTSVSITALTGYNFLSGATVQLINSGDQSNISATGVSVVSGSTITCTFAIPSNADVGAWDVYVTNPDGYVGKYSNGFIVHQSTSATATTTTSASGTLTVTGISPSISSAGAYLDSTVTGANFVAGGNTGGGSTVRLTSSTFSDIIAATYGQTSTTSIRVFFTIPAQNSAGLWNVVVTNPDGTTATLTGGLTING